MKCSRVMVRPSDAVPTLRDLWLLNDRTVLDAALVPVAGSEMVSCVVSIFSLC